jgi:type I restriction enzyme M protein
MLDSVTKRRIDTCRDILVGKIPDPKSQVEQITIALIYKFMDDMDLESEELGGARKFFTGEFERYAWGKLVAPGTSGQDMLNTYGEALQRMTENEKLPALFRDIFRNAYLPYRDPETLRSFLREINGFTYDHSERLGDAFEYLLSVLGSQGDAGQFRTPRHIIDFMVEIIDPKKDDVILDPACGTAGFLISSYKHILKANSSAADVDDNGDSESAVERPIESPLRFAGDLLTGEDRQRLARNIKGYDISPDMVRLSLVNLYLHGFANPRVEEYDTLTSEGKWSEMADVILANPPFMSPKGGIRPHNRFSISASRSEVLFVDYIAEHLTPNGRAAVIVPEGVIFQSGSAYKALRKMLVENFLVAVVSLPAGVFNPYSGVKTSILILDRVAAKGSDTIGFFKIENDGFNLGAQRRPVGGSELPDVLAEIAEYRSCKDEEDWMGRFGRAVLKTEIAANAEFNLGGDRYHAGSVQASSWPIVALSDAFARVGDTVEPASLPGPVNYVGLENITQSTGKLVGDVCVNDPSQIKSLKGVFRPGDILYGKLRPNLNKVWLADREGICSTDIFVVRSRDERVVSPLYSFLFRSARFNEAVVRNLQGAQLPRVSWSSFESLEIPLPPLDVQREVVAEIEGYQKVIDGARAVLENYRPHIAIDPAWPRVSLGEIASAESGFGFPLDQQGRTTEEIPFLKVSDMNLPGNEVRIVTQNHTVSRGDIAALRAKVFPAGTVIFPKIGAAIATNKKRILSCPATYDNNVMGIVPEAEKLSSEYLYAYLIGFDLSRWASTASPPSMKKSTVEAELIPLPPLETQHAIVAELEAERALVETSRQLVARMEAKIEAAIARVWGDADHVAPEEIAA